MKNETPEDFVLSLDFTAAEVIRLVALLCGVLSAGGIMAEHRDFAVEILHEIGEEIDA